MTTPAPSPPTRLEPPAAPASSCTTGGAHRQAIRPCLPKKPSFARTNGSSWPASLISCPSRPAAPFVRQSLLARLRRKLGLPVSSPIHRIDRNTAGLVAFAVQLPAPPASSFSEQVLSQRQVSRTCEAIAQTLPACLAALLRRPRAAAVCCAMSAFSPCTKAEGTPSSETRMARLAPPATAGAPPGLCQPFHRTAARV